MLKAKIFEPLRKIGTVALGCAVLLLGACATKEEVPVFSADPAAFELAIKEAVTMQAYANLCGQLGNELSALADAATNGWNERNWAQVEVADRTYSKNLQSQVVQYRGENLALAAVRLKNDVLTGVERRLDQSRRSYSSVLNTCSSKLNAYRDGGLDLTDVDNNADMYLKSLAGASVSSSFPVPSLAGNVEVKDKPGRSQYSIELTMHEWQCSGGTILTFVNEWPNEAYGIFCASGDTIFVSCAWGDCSVQQN